MSDIRIRTGWELNRKVAYVKYEDHLAALSLCEQRKDAEHADCRCNELEAMAIVDGKYESVAINGQLLERRDITLGDARSAVAALLDDDDIKCCSDHTMPIRMALAAIDSLQDEG